MTPLLLAVVLALLFAAGVACGALGPRLHRRTPAPVLTLLEQRLRDRFVVTLVGGDAFSGLLSEVDDRTVVLVDAVALKRDGAHEDVAGELVLRRDAVVYMQRP